MWIDITELFDRFLVANHPTGVSRVVLNVAERLIQAPGDVFAAARPILWPPGARVPVTFDGAALGPLTEFFPRLRELYDAAGLERTPYSSRTMKAIATSLPRPLRYRLFPADNGAHLFALWARRRGIGLTPVDFARGDCLFFPGSFWNGRYRQRLVSQARAAGVPITALVYDLLLVSHPQWLPGPHARQFRRACEALLPQCAALASISHQTMHELRRLLPLPGDLPIEVCRLADRPSDAPLGEVPAGLAQIIDKRYVMFVSTIIPRKNHRLLVEAWRELWRRFGPQAPYLLFVGGGDPDDELAGLMAREEAEGGRVIRLKGVDDAGLETLYRHAWITAYPSLGEGYGLPVAEALSRGKVCLAAPVGGILEAGAGLIDVIDPADAASVAAVVSGYMADPARLAFREAEIRRQYRSTSWSQTARAVLTVLETTVVAG